MKFKDKEAWDEGLSNQSDDYGKAIYDYAERWANLMEEQMLKWGVAVKDVAEKSSHDADTDGITGFMYGAAVQVLSHCWKHGEELRQWHNLDCQIGNEGEKANENGGVISPAILTVKEG